MLDIHGRQPGSHLDHPDRRPYTPFMESEVGMTTGRRPVRKNLRETSRWELTTRGNSNRRPAYFKSFIVIVSPRVPRVLTLSMVTQ